jgi:hypothetical protein
MFDEHLGSPSAGSVEVCDGTRVRAVECREPALSVAHGVANGHGFSFSGAVPATAPTYEGTGASRLFRSGLDTALCRPSAELTQVWQECCAATGQTVRLGGRHASELLAEAPERSTVG